MSQNTNVSPHYMMETVSSKNRVNAILNDRNKKSASPIYKQIQFKTFELKNKNIKSCSPYEKYLSSKKQQQKQQQQVNRENYHKQNQQQNKNVIRNNYFQNPQNNRKGNNRMNQERNQIDQKNDKSQFNQKSLPLKQNNIMQNQKPAQQERQQKQQKKQQDQKNKSEIQEKKIKTGKSPNYNSIHKKKLNFSTPVKQKQNIENNINTQKSKITQNHKNEHTLKKEQKYHFEDHLKQENINYQKQINEEWQRKQQLNKEQQYKQAFNIQQQNNQQLNKVQQKKEAINQDQQKRQVFNQEQQNKQGVNQEQYQKQVLNQEQQKRQVFKQDQQKKQGFNQEQQKIQVFNQEQQKKQVLNQDQQKRQVQEQQKKQGVNQEQQQGVNQEQYQKQELNQEQQKQQEFNQEKQNKQALNIEQQKRQVLNQEQQNNQQLNQEQQNNQELNQEQQNKQALNQEQQNKQPQTIQIIFDQNRLDKTVELAKQLTQLSSKMRNVEQNYSYYLQQYEDQQGLFFHYSIKQLIVKNNLKKYCQKILHVRGDGNCFYTAFGFQFLSLILIVYNENEFNEFIHFVKESQIKFKIYHKNFQIDDDKLEQLLMEQFLYTLQQIRKIQDQQDRIHELYQQYREFEISDKGNGCFYFLSTIFFRNLSNQLLEYSDMKAYVEDRINLLIWETECNNNEVIIATLAKYLKINIKLLFFQAGQFEVRQYEEHLPNEIVLLIQPGHYNIGLKN